MVDVLFVNPTNSEGVYQGLSKKLSAIETPTWSLLLAESCRSLNYSVDILVVIPVVSSINPPLLTSRTRFVCIYAYTVRA